MQYAICFQIKQFWLVSIFKFFKNIIILLHFKEDYIKCELLVANILDI